MPVNMQPELSVLGQTIAHGIAQAHRTGVAWNPGGFDDALTLEEAYRVQRAVAAELGWFPQGRAPAWKVGGRAPNITGSPLPRVLPTGARWPRTPGGELVLEAEIAVRLGRTPAHADDVIASIAGMCAAIELVGTRLEGGLTAPTPWKIADQQVHATLFAGPEVAFHAGDWSRQSFRVEIDGVQVAEGTGTLAHGDPTSTLSWLHEHARRSGLPLQAGDLITTGAWAALPVGAGQRIRCTFEGIGEVEALLAQRMSPST